MSRMLGFLDINERLKRVNELGDQLEAYARAVDFEAFRSNLEHALAYSTGTQGSRPPCDPVLMLMGVPVRTIDITRAKTAIGMVNLVLQYPLSRMALADLNGIVRIQRGYNPTISAQCRSISPDVLLLEPYANPKNRSTAQKSCSNRPEFDELRAFQK